MAVSTGYVKFYIVMCFYICVSLVSIIILRWSYLSPERNQKPPAPDQHDKSNFDPEFATRLMYTIGSVELEGGQATLCQSMRQPLMCDDLSDLQEASLTSLYAVLQLPHDDEGEFQNADFVSRLHQCRHLLDMKNSTEWIEDVIYSCYSGVSYDMTSFATAAQMRAPPGTWVSQIELLNIDMLIYSARKTRVYGSLHILKRGSTALLKYVESAKSMSLFILLLLDKHPAMCYSTQQRQLHLDATVWWFRNITVQLDGLLFNKAAILKKVGEATEETVSQTCTCDNHL